MGAVFWGPTPNGTFHALEDASAERKRSLCGLRIDIDDSLVAADVPLSSKCRSCLEKVRARP